MLFRRFSSHCFKDFFCYEEINVYVKDELFTGIKLTNLGKYLKNITIETTAGNDALLS